MRGGTTGVAFRIRSAVQYRLDADCLERADADRHGRGAVSVPLLVVAPATAITLSAVRPDGGTAADADAVQVRVMIAVAITQVMIRPRTRVRFLDVVPMDENLAQSMRKSSSSVALKDDSSDFPEKIQVAGAVDE
jgi:hypothetical protein